MEYVVHRRFKNRAAYGKIVDIPVGAKFESIGYWIATKDGKAICAITSENAKRHFARNDDGCGLKRGELTYAIAFGPRREGEGFRFSDDEIEMLESRWSHFLNTEVDTILFNDNFFKASMLELWSLASALNIKVRG